MVEVVGVSRPKHQQVGATGSGGLTCLEEGGEGRNSGSRAEHDDRFAAVGGEHEARRSMNPGGEGFLGLLDGVQQVGGGGPSLKRVGAQGLGLRGVLERADGEADLTFGGCARSLRRAGDRVEPIPVRGDETSQALVFPWRRPQQAPEVVVRVLLDLLEQRPELPLILRARLEDLVKPG